MKPGEIAAQVDASSLCSPALTPEQRALVLCWFCWCGLEIPPGAGRCEKGHDL